MSTSSRLDDETTTRLFPRFPAEERTVKRVCTNRADQKYRPRHALPDTGAWPQVEPTTVMPPVGDSARLIAREQLERAVGMPLPPRFPTAAADGSSRLARLKSRAAQFLVDLGFRRWRS
jgi:hypothetical protein